MSAQSFLFFLVFCYGAGIAGHSLLPQFRNRAFLEGGAPWLQVRFHRRFRLGATLMLVAIGLELFFG